MQAKLAARVFALIRGFFKRYLAAAAAHGRRRQRAAPCVAAVAARGASQCQFLSFTQIKKLCRILRTKLQTETRTARRFGPGRRRPASTKKPGDGFVSGFLVDRKFGGRLGSRA
jgi:hypothetical protein